MRNGATIEKCDLSCRKIPGLKGSVSLKVKLKQWMRIKFVIFWGSKNLKPFLKK